LSVLVKDQKAVVGREPLVRFGWATFGVPFYSILAYRISEDIVRMTIPLSQGILVGEFGRHRVFSIIPTKHEAWIPIREKLEVKACATANTGEGFSGPGELIVTCFPLKRNFGEHFGTFRRDNEARRCKVREQLVVIAIT
jgi:hypothetical protein